MINLVPRLAIAGCAALIPVGIYVNYTSGTKNTSSAHLLESKLKEIQEVSTAEVRTNISVTQRDENKVGQLTVGQTEVFYNANVVIKAGIVNAQLVQEGDRAVIIADPPTITNAYLDLSNSQIVTQHKSWIAPDTQSALTEQAQKQAVQEAVKRACEGGILQKANENALNFFKAIAPSAEVRLEQGKCE